MTTATFREMRGHSVLTNYTQAQKFSRAIDDVDDDELGEDSVMLESPLDKIEPYQLFKGTLLSKWLIRRICLGGSMVLLTRHTFRNATRAAPILR